NDLSPMGFRPYETCLSKTAPSSEPPCVSMRFGQPEESIQPHAHAWRLRKPPREHVAAFLIALALLTSCGKKAEEAAEKEPPRPVMVENVVRGAIDHVIAADAVVHPVNQSNVTSKISAPVRRVLVNRGDHVRAGQLLFELEGGDLAAAVEE